MSWTLYWLQWISVIKIDTQKRPAQILLCAGYNSYETKMSQRLLHKCLFLGAVSDLDTARKPAAHCIGLWQARSAAWFG